MDTLEITLVKPTKDLTDELSSMAEEFNQAGEDKYQEVLEGADAFFERIHICAAGVNLPDNVVRENTFWLVQEGRILGQSRLRHWLTRSLEMEGGHIGYDIRPSERGKGYGGKILGMTLAKAKVLGLNRVMMTCDEDNITSSKVIEKNGGVLAGTATSEKTGKRICRYWVEL